MAYSQYNAGSWADLPSTSTPVTAARLQAIENAVAAASGQIVSLNAAVAALQTGTGTGGTVTGDTTAPVISSFTAAPGAAQVALTWAATDNVGVTRCVVTRGTTQVYTGTARTFTDTALTNGSAYTYTLTVYDAANNSSSRTVTATPVATATKATVTIGAPTVSGTSVTVAWTTALGSDGVTPASATVSRDGSDTTGAGAYSATAQAINGTITFAQLVTGTTYHFTVQLVDSTGANYGAPAVAQATIGTATGGTSSDTVAPGTVTLSATAVAGGNEIDLTWTTATDNVAVTGYRVTRNGTVLATNVTGTSYADRTTVPATPYTYSVQAYDAAGNMGAASNTVGISSSAAGTTTPTGPSGPSGSWRSVFFDDFLGTSLDTTTWDTQEGRFQNDVTMHASNVSVANSELRLTLASSSSGAQVGTALVGEATKKPNGYLFKIGDYVEARVWFPGDGTRIANWPAFWTSGPSWPTAGEIDVAESFENGVLSVNYHYGTAASPQANNGNGRSGYWGDAWHVYGVQRLANSVNVYWDGVLARTIPTSDNGNPHGVLLTNGYGTTPAQIGAVVRVDWVRAWTPA